MEQGFIAYIGSDLTEKDIKKLLTEVVLERTEEENEDFKVRIRKSGSAIFGQVIDCDDKLEYALPYLFKENLLYVASYDPDDLYSCVTDCDYEDEYELDEDKYHELIPMLLEDYDEVAFKMLHKKELSYSYASYNKKTRQLTVAKMGDNVLFYGYTKQNHEIIFSDYEEIIQEVCDSVYKFPDESYYQDGVFHKYNKEKEQIIYENPEVFEQKQDSKKKLLFNNFTSAKNLLDGLNEILFGITDTTLRTNIEKAFNEYFEGLEPQKKVGEFIDKNLSIELQKKLLEVIKQEIEKFNISQQVQGEMSQVFQKVEREINERITESVEECLSQQSFPKINIIKLSDTEIGRTDVQFFHEKFEEILSLVQLDEPVMLIGPAGSGKNHSISQIAQALGLHMYYTNNASNEFKLTGFIDAGGHYRGTEFYKAFKNGGIFFLDEIDNSDPSALIVINSALANGYMAFPHETIDRHPDFRMVAAANTWGKGSDLQYVGRMALDGASLDRFDNVFFDYDRKLERGLYPSEQVLKFMWSFRDAVESTKIPHIVSTRGIGKVYKKEINGIPIETILRVNVIRNLNQDDLNTILGNMENIDKNNKYYENAKSLQLVKKPKNHITIPDGIDEELPFN